MSALGWGQLSALSCAITWALAIVLFRRSGENLPAFELNLFKNALGLLLLIPTLALTIGFAWPDYSASELWVVLLSGFLGIAVADTWYLRALSLMGASRTGIVASLFSPFVVMLSVMFLGERLAGGQLAGFGLVMAGILLVSWNRKQAGVDAARLRIGTLYGAAAVFMSAVGVVMVKEILETRPFLWTVELRLIGGVGGMLIYVGLRQRWVSVATHFRQPQPWLWIITASVLASYVSMMFWLAGYKFIPASQASVLNESGNAWIVLFAWLFLGETIGARKIAGLLLTFTGVLLMLLV